MRKCTSEKFHREKFITEERVPTAVIQHAFFEFIIFLGFKNQSKYRRKKRKMRERAKARIAWVFASFCAFVNTLMHKYTCIIHSPEFSPQPLCGKFLDPRLESV